MTLPIIALGNEILRKISKPVVVEDEKIETLLDEMWISMNESDGVGLAAPQVNRSLNLFVINTKIMYERLTDDERINLFPDEKGIKETFINTKIVSHSEITWSDYEGCLSIPGVYETVERSWEITLEYFDENFNAHTRSFSGYNAKVIQHEYDHTQGVLFIDRLSPLRKKLLKSKLNRIVVGKVNTNYPIVFKKHTS
ncbi:MAG: peptide deformylase [Prolixibacteraceae bacterium]